MHCRMESLNRQLLLVQKWLGVQPEPLQQSHMRAARSPQRQLPHTSQQLFDVACPPWSHDAPGHSSAEARSAGSTTDIVVPAAAAPRNVAVRPRNERRDSPVAVLTDHSSSVGIPPPFFRTVNRRTAARFLEPARHGRGGNQAPR